MEQTTHKKYVKRSGTKQMDYKKFINQCVWSLEDYSLVKEFIFRVKHYIHNYGAYTLDDLKHEFLFIGLPNEEFETRSYSDCNKGWTDSKGFNFEILGKDCFKVIIPWDDFHEDLTEPLAELDHETSVACGTMEGC